MSGWMDGWYVVPYEVAWRDIDGIGHVNNATFFTLFEIGRTKYWLDFTGAGYAGPTSIDFIVARAECDFIRQVGLGEQLHICVRISEMRNSSFDFETEVRTASGGEIAARGKVVVVYFSWEKGTKLAITDELRLKVKEFQKER